MEAGGDPTPGGDIIETIAVEGHEGKFLIFRHLQQHFRQRLD